MPPDSISDQPIFSARLHPHRSLSQQNFRVLMWVMVAANTVLGVPFFLLGAWPVVGFMGLDILLVYVAFRASYRAARGYEEVSLSCVELKLAKVCAKGRAREWRFNPLWVRLEQEEDEEFGLQKLALVSRGDRIALGTHVGPVQKAAFAGDLSKALAQAKRGPRYS